MYGEGGPGNLSGAGWKTGGESCPEDSAALERFFWLLTHSWYPLGSEIGGGGSKFGPGEVGFCDQNLALDLTS